MKTYHLAIDIGASSGRHILGTMNNGKLVLEEIYRFENGMENINGELSWNYESLFSNIVIGLKKCKELGKIPKSIGIDTWGVDFVLLDKDDNVIGNMVGYRDHRTDGMDEEVYQLVSEEKLFAQTGIQKQIYNTIYQLMAVKKKYPEFMERAESFLMVPDYFHFRLTGKKRNEITNASTTQLLSVKLQEWDFTLIDKLGYKKSIFGELIEPGTSLGTLLPEIQRKIGYNAEVILPSTHDTASAVLAVPAYDDDYIYISSGTWSLLGIEKEKADCSQLSKEENFSNEIGYGKNILFLKNIMGLWMIQSIRNNLDKKYLFSEICAEAQRVKDFPARVDVNSDCFMAPQNMICAIQKYCKETGQDIPESIGELATVSYASLVECYREAIDGVEKLTGKTYKFIHIVGGGSNADYLNQMIAQATGKEVHAGPGEATAIGNIISQMIQYKEFASIDEARKIVHKSFDVQIYR